MKRTSPSKPDPVIFGGTAGRHLATSVCRHLNLSESHIAIGRFSDGETSVKILDNVRGADCYLIQPTCPPVNENLMELLVCVDAMRRASAERINIIIPYFGYARQDRKDQGRVALTAKLVANLIAISGVHRVICLDLHSPQIQGFFDIPVDHLYAGPNLLEYLKAQSWSKNLLIVSPDVGNVKHSRGYASRLDVPLAIIDKRRSAANVSEVMNIVGDVEGYHCLLCDDLIDTGGTLCNAAVALKKAGALSVAACATHAVLSGPARKQLQESPLDRIIVTDSIEQKNDDQLNKLEIVKVAPMIAKAIDRIHNFLSVSELFN